jgi:glycosyltransferase involved in cell wall biosynthesis
MNSHTKMIALKSLAVTHVIAGMKPEDGGPSYSVPSLAYSLEQIGVNTVIRCIEGPRVHKVNDVKINTYQVNKGILCKKLRASSTLAEALRDDAEAGAILHTHGLWLMPNIYPGWIRQQFPGTKIVHSTRGMLGPAALDISRWRKKAVWWLAQRKSLEIADCIHATAESEYEDVRRAGLRQPVAIVPNGIHIPKDRLITDPDNFTVLSLGRVHPKKGLDILIRAWAQIYTRFPNWRLSIVGPAEQQYKEELHALADKLQAARLTIAGPCYGEEKHRLMREADLFALPTLNENFGVTVAEALSAGTPVISTKGAPWRGLMTEQCGWWVDHGVEPFAAALQDAMQLTASQRMAMGQRGRAWMSREFTWDRVASDMLEVYSWLKNGGEPPKSVRID